MTITPGSDANAEKLVLVRAFDRDRYISALMAPDAARMDLMTLFAFDAELARIPAVVSEPLLGEIRLQWWRDSLSALLTDAGRTASSTAPAESRTGNPLADDLMAMARARGLPGGLLHGLIDARSTALSDAPLADEGQLWAYLAKTEVGLISLALQLLGGIGARPPVSPAVADACGRAIGLVRIARAVTAGRPEAELLVPLSIWPRDGRHGGGVIEPASSGRQRAIAALLDLAERDLARARPAVAGLPRTLRPAVLPLALVARYVTHLRRPIGEQTTRPPDINPLVRMWTMWRACHQKHMI